MKFSKSNLSDRTGSRRRYRVIKRGTREDIKRNIYAAIGQVHLKDRPGHVYYKLSESSFSDSITFIGREGYTVQEVGSGRDSVPLVLSVLFSTGCYGDRGKKYYLPVLKSEYSTSD